MRSRVRPVVLCALLAAWGRAPSAEPLPGAADSDLPRRPNAPVESYTRADVLYDSVFENRGERARVILTRPHDGSGKYPAIFVAGWLSCDSVEAPADTNDASGKVFRVLAELPGFVTVRMDKPGVGDSEGVCKETDFDTELSSYRAAFRRLSRYPFIDKNSVFVFGISNGGG